VIFFLLLQFVKWFLVISNLLFLLRFCFSIPYYFLLFLPDFCLLFFLYYSLLFSLCYFLSLLLFSGKEIQRDLNYFFFYIFLVTWLGIYLLLLLRDFIDSLDFIILICFPIINNGFFSKRDSLLLLFTFLKDIYIKFLLHFTPFCFANPSLRFLF